MNVENGLEIFSWNGAVCIHKAELEQADGVVYTLIGPLYFDVQDMTTNMENI